MKTIQKLLVVFVFSAGSLTASPQSPTAPLPPPKTANQQAQSNGLNQNPRPTRTVAPKQPNPSFCPSFHPPTESELSHADDDFLRAMQLTARQCVAEAASKRVRLAALDAYDLIGSELNGRYEVQVSQVAQDEIEKKQQQHDQEMQDTLAATKKTGASIGAFLDAVNQQDRRLTSQYNRLVDNYNDLSDRYRNVYNLALEAVNLAESLNNQRSSSLPIFVEAPKPTPLHCTADTTYHFGILTTSTTYMDCR